jgi:hypothetical protein
VRIDELKYAGTHLANGQKALLALLSAELDLAFVMLQTADLEPERGLRHRLAIYARVRSTMVSARHLARIVKDARAAEGINARIDEIASIVDGLSI